MSWSMMFRKVCWSLPLLLAACAAEPVGVHVLAPEDVEFPWNAAYNGAEDGRSAVIPLDVMVWDASSGLPRVGEAVALWSDSVGFVPADAVWVAEVGCSTCVWDAYRDAYLDVAPSVDPLVLLTDADGLARAYAVVDQLDEDGAGYVPAAVQVQSGEQGSTVLLQPR